MAPGKSLKKAVSPVLATLLMVAIAVSMSVIMFTWSQGFLSTTSEASSSQQQSQNLGVGIIRSQDSGYRTPKHSHNKKQGQPVTLT